MNPKSSIIAALAAGILVAAASAQPYAIDWHVVASGGGVSTGGTIELAGNVGQWDANPAAPMTGGGFSLTGGFWTAAVACACPGDLTGDGDRNGDDIQLFLTCVVAGGPCACAEVDGLATIDAADVAQFITDLLNDAPCP